MKIFSSVIKIYVTCLLFIVAVLVPFGDRNDVLASCDVLCSAHSCTSYGKAWTCDDNYYQYSCSWTYECVSHGEVCWDPDPATECITPIPPITYYGCMDNRACNYNSTVTVDNGTCEYSSCVTPPSGGGGGGGGNSGPVCGNGKIDAGEDCDGGAGCTACVWDASTCALPNNITYYSEVASLTDWRSSYLADNKCYWPNQGSEVDLSCVETQPTTSVLGTWRYTTSGGDELPVGKNACRRDNISPGTITSFGPGDPGNQDDDYHIDSCYRKFACASYTTPSTPTFNFSCVGSCVVPFNSPATISWSAVTNTTGCTASGGWSGAKSSAGGSYNVSDLVTDTTYTLTCASANGSVEKSVTFTVQAPSLPKFNVSVSKNVNSGGVITSSPMGIDCGPVCAYDFYENSSVILTPIPSSSYWKFAGWGGDCSGFGLCAFIVDGIKSVSASFVPRPFIYEEF